MNIHVLTVATDKTPQLSNLTESLQKFGYSYSILGLGKQWTGFSFKTEHYLAAVSDLPPNTIVALVDAYDVIFVASPEEFIQKYRSLDTPVIVGGEPRCRDYQCTPVTNYWALNGRHTMYPYVNSGVIVGPADKLKQILTNQLNSPFKNDDQKSLGYVVQQYPILFRIDTTQRLIGTWIPTKSGRIKIHRNRPMDTHSMEFPVILHMPCVKCDIYRRYARVTRLTLGDKAVGISWRDRINIIVSVVKKYTFHIGVGIVILVIMIQMIRWSINDQKSRPISS